MNVRTIIVDDEPLAIAVMEGYLSKIPGVEVVATFSDGLPAFEFLQHNSIDVIFLDVEMPKLTGIELVKSLKNPPVVIIISANRDYAIDGFELNVVDYILKPVTLERLLRAYAKVLEILSSRTKYPDIQYEDYLLLKESKKNIRIRVDDILYIESIKDYSKVVTHARTVITKQSISRFKEQLPDDKFVRIHRSFIVALKHVNAFTSSAVEVNDIEIPIGRLYKDEVLRILESRK